MHAAAPSPALRRQAPLCSAALLLFCLVAILFLPTLRNGFVWDDEPYILTNPNVAGGPTAANIAWAFTSFWQANWHPLTWLSHMLDVWMFGFRPAGHHFVSVILHAANAGLLFVFLARLTGLRGASLLVAAFFATHPLRVESVAWVAERKDLLCAFFCLLCLSAWLSYLRRPRRSRYFLALGLFAAALLAKPMALTLPFLLLLLDFWPLRRLTRAAVGEKLLEKVPFLAFSVASGIVTLAAQSRGEAISLHYPAGLRVANALVAYVAYLEKTLAPVGLSCFYPHPSAIPLWQSAGALLLLAFLTTFALVSLHERPYVAIGWFWFLGALLPVIGFVQAGAQAYANRYTYLPHIGLLLAGVLGARDLLLARHKRSQGQVLAATGKAGALVVLGTLMVLTELQLPHWKDNISLGEYALTVDPRNWQAHNNLGAALFQQGRIRQAADHVREALLINPNLSPAWLNLGKFAFLQGRYSEAEAHFLKALSLRPRYGEAENGLGASLLARQMPRQAMAHFERARRLDPRDPLPIYNLGAAAAALGDVASARRLYTEALRLKPDYELARAGLAKL